MASELDGAADDSFRAVRTTEEPVHPRSHEAARSGYRVFRAQGGFEAAIPEQVIARALAVGRRSAPNEWHGHVVGRLFEHQGRRHVVVDGIVPDPDARAWPSFVETTAESELRTRTAARLLFPDGIVLGWVHGHVGHGARFSGTDRKTQATWRQPHALGIVVDPWATDGQVAAYRGPECELLAEMGTAKASCSGAELLIPEESISDGPHEAAERTLRWRGYASVIAAFAMALLMLWACVRVRGEIRLLKDRLHLLETAVAAHGPPAPESCHAGPASARGPACRPDGIGE